LVGALPPIDERMFKISDSTWCQWINSSEPMAGAPEMSGDPQEGPFVAEVPCFGGAYLTLPSDDPSDQFIVDCLLEAALLRMGAAKTRFAQEVTEIALTGLWISDECVRRAGLTRHTEPGHTENSDIRWPSGQEARKLQGAVRFSRGEVQDYLCQRHLGTGGLTILGFAPGGISASYSGHLANPMCRRPLLVTGDRVIVISPSTVLIAIRDAVLESAHKYGVGPEVADSFRATVQSRIEEYADLQRWRKLGSRQVKCAGTKVDEAYFQFDEDKIAVTYTVCDDLRTGSTRPEERHWDLTPITRGLQRRIAAAERTVFTSPDAPSEILHVIIFQGVGRPSQHSIKKSGDSRAVRLALTADEFRVFTLLNLNDELALWQVAQALYRMPRRTAMVFGGFLDHYAIYRKRGESYYFGDEGVMDAVMLVATGIHVRLDMQRRLDPHVVRHPQSQSYGPVMRLQSRLGFPIYAVPPSRSRGVQFLVEGLPIPLWVVAGGRLPHRQPTTATYTSISLTL
jgi:hypothetical protein